MLAWCGKICQTVSASNILRDFCSYASIYTLLTLARIERSSMEGMEVIGLSSYHPGVLTCRNRLASDHCLITTHLASHHHHHLPSPLTAPHNQHLVPIAFFDCYSMRRSHTSSVRSMMDQPAACQNHFLQVRDCSTEFGKKKLYREKLGVFRFLTSPCLYHDNVECWANWVLNLYDAMSVTSLENLFYQENQ